jgi:hypothetical protein
MDQHHGTGAPGSHVHVGWNMPGCLPDSEPATFATFNDAKAYLIGELLAAADSVATWGEPHACHDVPCPNHGDHCPDRLANELSLAAEDLNLASEPRWGEVVAGYAWWVEPCSKDGCELEDEQ